jgi:hypothetical protein
VIELSDLGNEAALTVVGAVSGKVFCNAHAIRRLTPPMCYVSNLTFSSLAVEPWVTATQVWIIYGTYCMADKGQTEWRLDSQVAMEVVIPVRT